MDRVDVHGTGAEARGPGSGGADAPIGPGLPWLTPRRIIVFVTAWLAAFAVGSVAVANPFQSEPSAAATPDYWHVMYLHGLLIGMVGLVALVVLQVFGGCCSRHVRVGIALGVVAATVLTTMGGIWDTRVPGAEAAMWTQIAGFFCLDEILVFLILGFWQGWRARAPQSRSLPFVAGWLAAASMLIAALMGHLAGWILEFGGHPWFLVSYARFIGVSYAAFTSNLITSHSHEMAVASMALVLSAAVWKLGYPAATGALRAVSRVGMALVAFGIVAMTGVYVAMAVSSWVVPTYFQSADGTDGVAGDDLLTGVLVMGGGLLALWPVAAHGLKRVRGWLGSPLPAAAAWAWTGTVLGVVLAGYWIELNETFFGAGSAKAAGAANDAVFTWLHQDVGLFLLPALVAVMLLADGLVSNGYRGLAGWSALLGVTMLLLGGGIWVFVDSALRGPGYVLSTIGMGLLAVSIAAVVISGLLGDAQVRLVFRHRPHGHGRIAHGGAHG